MTSPRFRHLPDYLESLSDAKQETVGAIIQHVLTTTKNLECKIAWNVPQVHRGADYVLGISSAATHLSIAPWSPEVMAEFTPRLESLGLVVRKNLFQVPDDWAVDTLLLDDLVQTRLAELS